jgi:uncharacterized protein (DUF885 family)
MASSAEADWPSERQMVGRAVFHAEGLRRPRLASAWRTPGHRKGVQCSRGHDLPFGCCIVTMVSDKPVFLDLSATNSDIMFEMTRRTIMLPLMFFAQVLRAPESNITEFFERFTAEWVRADPYLATFSQYFSGAEQDQLDSQLLPYTAEFRKQRVERAKTGLDELRRFDRKQLSASQRVSLRMLEWQLDTIVQGDRYEDYGYVFNQGINGEPGGLIRFLTNAHPARMPRDVENYLKRLSQVSGVLDTMIAEARQRAARGIVPPRFILTATIEQIERLASPEADKNVLVETYGERIAKVASISDKDRARFRVTAPKLVGDSVVPALRRVIALLEEQRKTATDEAGFSALPGGAEAYTWRLHVNTSTGLTADQIHRTGLEQVARLERQMDELLRQLGYREGSIQDRYQKSQSDNAYPDRPDSRTAMLAEYEKIIRDAERRSAALFDLRPRATVVVRRVPEYAERNASAYYSLPARDGSRPGVFYVPMVGPKFLSHLGMRTRVYHEAIPGHHFQLALQQEDANLPRFRSDAILYEGTTAFVEGWGLYAEALALENGWYDKDEPGRLGALEGQLFRARRLVVDTGLHTKGWSRRRAVEYGITDSEVDRYVASPGQACSYMIGELKLLALRDKARRELGDRFSLKEFHNVVLTTGAVPLEVLEEALNDYVESKK